MGKIKILHFELDNNLGGIESFYLIYIKKLIEMYFNLILLLKVISQPLKMIF